MLVRYTLEYKKESLIPEPDDGKVIRTIRMAEVVEIYQDEDGYCVMITAGDAIDVISTEPVSDEWFENREKYLFEHGKEDMTVFGVCFENMDPPDMESLRDLMREQEEIINRFKASQNREKRRQQEVEIRKRTMEMPPELVDIYK